MGNHFSFEAITSDDQSDRKSTVPMKLLFECSSEVFLLVVANVYSIFKTEYLNGRIIAL